MRTRQCVGLAVLVLVAAATGCSSEGKVDQSLGSNMAQAIVNAAPMEHRVQNLPGHMIATVEGRLVGGDHWDQHGRRYVPKLLLTCQGRQSLVSLLFSTLTGGSTPLRERGGLSVLMTRDGRERRTVPLTRNTGSYRLEGALPLVHELLNSSDVTLQAVTQDNQSLTATFDMRGLKHQLARYDFYCARAWLSDASPEPTPARPVATGDAQSRPVISTHTAQRLEQVRGSIAGIEGVVTALWLPDKSMMVGMAHPSPSAIRAVVREVCDRMRSFPEVTQQVQVQDVRGQTAAVVRMDCPR